MAVALLLKSLLALAPAVSLDGHALHFLALNVRNGHEQYSVHVQRSDAWEPAALEHASGDEWRLSIGDDTRILHAGPPDTVFSAAMGETTAPSLRAAAPHWPPSLLHSLETRRRVRRVRRPTRMKEAARRTTTTATAATATATTT